MSAAFDYSGLQSTATTLITQFGRAMTLTRDSRVPDPTKPWLTEQGDTSAASAQSIATVGVFTSLDRELAGLTTVERKLGLVLVRTESELPEEVGSDWHLVDGDRTYEVLLSRPLKPGPVLMLYKLGVVL